MDDLHALRLQYEQLLDRLQRNEREFRRLGRAVWRVQEDERRRLARELHDGVGQNLTALKHRLMQLATALPAADETLRDGLDKAIVLCTDALEDTRSMSRLLRPPILDDLGLEAALRWMARSQSEFSSAKVTLEMEALPPLDAGLQTLVFRVAQEALTNAAKHADAQQVMVRLVVRGGLLQLQIVDDGCGFDADAALQAAGGGLGGMRERLRLYDGRLELHSAPGQGTRLRAVVPLGTAAERPDGTA